MAKDGLTKRPWYRWSPRDFRADPNVFKMTRDQRWRYRDALDDSWLSDTPGEAPEDNWRRWLGFTTSEWPMLREFFADCFWPVECRDGSQLWLQRRLVDEFMAATAISRARVAGGKARQHQLSSSSGAAIESREVEVREQRTKNNLVNTSCPSPKTASVSGPLSLPTTGGGFWTPPAETLEAWKAAYPGVRVEAEIPRMRAWLLSNPTRAKTPRGISRFASAWLARAQDSGRSTNNTPTGEAAIAQFLAESRDHEAK